MTFSANGNRLIKEDATDFGPWGERLTETGQLNTTENRHLYQNKESLTLFGLEDLNDFGARYVDRTLGRMWGVDNLAEKFSNHSPYNYTLNNLLNMLDPDGNSSMRIGGYWNERGYDSEAAFSHYSMGESIVGNGGGGDKDKKKNEGSLTKSQCVKCLDPSTIGKNLFGLTYPGGNNPKNYLGDYDYSYQPLNIAEYPAIGHDRRYDQLKIEGASGLFTDTRAIGADWKFVSEELKISGMMWVKPVERLQALGLGLGLGLAATPKTIYKFLVDKNAGLSIYMDFKLSNIGVTNKPSINKHK